jgi:hypothetical protein
MAMADAHLIMGNIDMLLLLVCSVLSLNLGEAQCQLGANSLIV